MLEGLTVIFVCQLVGELLVTLLGLGVPGPVVGMVILLGGLMVRGGVPDQLETVAHGLLSHLSLLFIPAGVGVMLHAGVLGRDWLPISIALVVSTLAAISMAAWVMARLSTDEGEETADTGRGSDA